MRESEACFCVNKKLPLYFRTARIKVRIHV